MVVTIDVASPSDVSPLALAARGLSPREQEVAALVLQGAATKTIAAALFLSLHTVQDDLKSIFAELDVPADARWSSSSCWAEVPRFAGWSTTTCAAKLGA